MRFVVFLSVCLPGALVAQNISCSLSGSVSDPGGAVMPGVTVSVSSEQNGFARTATTNAEGFFSFPDLTASTFSLMISAPGFKKYTQTGIEITAGEKRSLGTIHLEIGAVTETVAVTAEAAPVMLGSGDKAGVITGDDLSRMALRGRDFMDAVGLLPGVIDTRDSRESPQPDSIGSIYILGGRSNSKNMTIDGVTNLDTGSNGSVHSMPSMDSVGEIKVLQSNYAAEHGRNAGGSITVITRGGGKQFHGSAGWYHRHEEFSANDFFNNRNGLPRQPYRYNIASYTLGGPIYIPGHFNQDRSRLFFFFSQEFQEQLVGYGSKTVRVPTALERGGDFSRSFDVNSRLISVLDPLNSGRQFPGNVIPASRINPVGRNVLNLFPLPNFVDPAPSRLYQWNYLSQVSGAYPRRTEIGRIDYSPHQNMAVYLRVSNNADQQHPSYTNWTTGSVNFPLTPIAFGAPGRGATLHATNTLSPTMFNELIFGVSQNKLRFYPDCARCVSRQATGITIPQFNPDLNPAGLIPNMQFGGVPNYANPSMNDGVPYYNSNTIFSVVENVSRISGTHSYKAGLYFERTRKDQSASVATRGTVNFGVDRNNPLDTNYAYGNALLGVFSSYAEATSRPQGQFRFSNVEWFAQDTWRASARLLLDYGVRFYHDLPQYDARYQLASFNPARYDPSQAPVLLRPALDSNKSKVALDPLTGKTYPAGLVGTYVPGVGNPADGMIVGGRNGVAPGLYEVPPVSAAGRFGFAWDPFGRGRTAIRGGAGMFYDRVQGNLTMSTLSNPPTIYTPTVYYGTIDGLAQTSGQGVLAPTGSISSLFGDQHLPTTYNYSLAWQQQVGSVNFLELAYAGSLSRHYSWQRNTNPVPAGADFLAEHPENRDPSAPTRPLPPNFLRPYQGFGDLFQYEFGATANYNSASLRWERRMRNGLLFGAAYTFSKTLGAVSGDTDKVSPFFAPRERDYGLLTFDRTHVMSMHYTWLLPKPGKRFQWRALGYVTDNWEISGITRFMSGAPFTPTFSTVDGQDITGTPSESARINVGNPAADPLHRFARPARGTFGTAGSNILRGPGTNNWDISLYRRVPFGERKSLLLRFETYNTCNHTQFSTLSTGARFDVAGNQVDPLFLQPTAARSPRRVQLALQLIW